MRWFLGFVMLSVLVYTIVLFYGFTQGDWAGMVIGLATLIAGALLEEV